MTTEGADGVGALVSRFESSLVPVYRSIYLVVHLDAWHVVGARSAGRGAHTEY